MSAAVHLFASLPAQSLPSEVSDALFFETDSSTEDQEEDKKRRRRAQNKINQRRHRLRAKSKEDDESKSKGRPFKVDRWRLDEPVSVHMTAKSNQPRTPTGTSTKLVHGQHKPQLPADELLTLIQFNVWRAVVSNKELLRRLAVAYYPDSPEPFQTFGDILSPVRNTIVGVRPSLPPAMYPTKLQSSIVHTNWFNILPFSEMRDNLITMEDHFDHVEFGRDTCGVYIKEDYMYWPFDDSKRERMKTIQIRDDDDDINGSIASDRNGLIVWGEPYREESWEASPGFLRKWGWVTEGCCDRLIRSTNYWREKRGESPLKVVDI